MMKYLKKYPWINKNKKYILISIFLIVVTLIAIKWIVHKIKMKYLHMVLLDIFKKTIPIFDKHNINYWAIGGTLLGSVREGKIIEYDDDIDLGILKKDYLRINDIKGDFEKVGLVIESPKKDFGLIKIMKKDNNYKKNKIFIDLFPYETTENKYIFSEVNAREIWPDEYFLDDEVFPFKKSKLEDIEINIPNKSVTFLERVFGDCKNNNDCWKIPTITHDHSDEINISLFSILFQ
jgi:phosphorylcholine metabolism protein LicD